MGKTWSLKFHLRWTGWKGNDSWFMPAIVKPLKFAPRLLWGRQLRRRKTNQNGKTAKAWKTELWYNMKNGVLRVQNAGYLWSNPLFRELKCLGSFHFWRNIYTNTKLYMYCTQNFRDIAYTYIAYTYTWHIHICFVCDTLGYFCECWKNSLLQCMYAQVQKWLQFPPLRTRFQSCLLYLMSYVYREMSFEKEYVCALAISEKQKCQFSWDVCAAWLCVGTLLTFFCGKQTGTHGQRHDYFDVIKAHAFWSTEVRH